jgi:hypothetical protein
VVTYESIILNPNKNGADRKTEMESIQSQLEKIKDTYEGKVQGYEKLGASVLSVGSPNL